MTSQRVWILVVVALIAVGAGVWLAARQSASPAGERALLYPGLKTQADAVQAVRIYKTEGEPAVEVIRKDAEWGVSQRAGYPADEGKLRKLLRALVDAKVLEEKTSNPENYKSLGVEDLKDGAAAGVRIELAGAPVDLVVGKSGPGATSQYVRKAGEPQSWLIDASIDTSATPEAWLRKELIDVSADRLQSVSVASGEQKPYTAEKASRADANFEVTGLPKGKKLSAPSAANGLATALAGVTLSDVQAGDAFADSPPAARATFTTFDGLIVQLDGWQRDEKRYIAVKSSYDPKVVERFKAPAPAEDKAPEAKEAPAKADEPKAEEPKKPNAAEDAKAISARTSGWVYEIPSYKYEQIFKPVDELVAS